MRQVSADECCQSDLPSLALLQVGDSSVETLQPCGDSVSSDSDVDIEDTSPNGHISTSVWIQKQLQFPEPFLTASEMFCARAAQPFASGMLLLCLFHDLAVLSESIPHKC